MRVETMVAIELAVSCRPLRRSNASATTIRPISTGRLNRTVMAPCARSKLIDDDRIYLIGDVFETIDDFFEMIVELRADDEAHRVALPIALRVVLSTGQEQRLEPLI